MQGLDGEQILAGGGVGVGVVGDHDAHTKVKGSQDLPAGPRAISSSWGPGRTLTLSILIPLLMTPSVLLGNPCSISGLSFSSVLWGYHSLACLPPEPLVGSDPIQKGSSATIEPERPGGGRAFL